MKLSDGTEPGGSTSATRQASEMTGHDRDHPTPDPPAKRLRRSRWRMTVAGVLGVYWLALFVLMHTPIKTTGQISHADKVAHFVLYGVLAGLISVWLSTSGRLTWRRVLPWYAFLAVYAVVDELLQIPVGRSCEAGDWLADMLGVGTAFLVGLAFQAYVLRGWSGEVRGADTDR